MKITTGLLMVLAVASGCSSFQSGTPDLGARSNYSARSGVPGPAPTTWLENDRMKANQYAGAASGTAASGTAAAVSVGPRPTTTTTTAVCDATPAPAPVMDSGVLPPPAPMTGTTAPAAPAAATAPPTVTGEVHQISYPDDDKSKPPLGTLPPTDVASAKAKEASAIKEQGIVAAAPAEPTPANVLPAKTEVVPGAAQVTETTTVSAKPSLLLETQPATQTPPSVRLVNNKRITINYEIKDVGPSGISGVELWYTQDGKTWKKRDVANQAKPPYVIEVADEGLYGFTLLARNGIGLAKEAPKAGDLPQIWVEVDMTKPTIQLTGIHANCSSKSQNVVIRWKASDKNFGPRPITISYAEKADGPWKVLAANLANTGRYEWPMPADAPSRFHVKIEAADLVGNIAAAQTPKPVLMDRSQPVIMNVTVEGAK